MSIEYTVTRCNVEAARERLRPEKETNNKGLRSIWRRGPPRADPGADVPSAPLDLRHPAVDEQFDARDETAVVGGEEQGDLRDLVGLAKPT
jgi:hypothetical protein